MIKKKKNRKMQEPLAKELKPDIKPEKQQTAFKMYPLRKPEIIISQKDFQIKLQIK